MSELFQEYRGKRPRDGVVAAAQVVKGSITQLSIITGGTAIAHKVRGGSMVYSEILLHGETAKLGDYIIADVENIFIPVPKDYFESKFELKGNLRETSSERR